MQIPLISTDILFSESFELKIFPDAFHWFLITKCGSSVSWASPDWVLNPANHVLSTTCVHSDRMHSDQSLAFWPKILTEAWHNAHRRRDRLTGQKKKLLTEAIFYIMGNSNEMFACFDFSVVVSCGKRPPIFFIANAVSGGLRPWAKDGG